MQILIKYTNNKEVIKIIPQEIINNTTLVNFKLILTEIEQQEQDIQYINILPYLHKRYTRDSKRIA